MQSAVIVSGTNIYGTTSFIVSLELSYNIHVPDIAYLCFGGQKDDIIIFTIVAKGGRWVRVW